MQLKSKMVFIKSNVKDSVSQDKERLLQELTKEKNNTLKLLEDWKLEKSKMLQHIIDVIQYF